MSEPLVWLPFDPSRLGDIPSGLRVRAVDLRDGIPDDVGEVEVYVPPLGGSGRRVRAAIDRMSSLRVVQSLSAGVENLHDAVPDGVVLCNGRGINDTSTAELAVTLVLASLRGIPQFVRDQDRREWNQGWHPALADKRVLIVGYGAIGSAIGARLAPFECDVVPIARTAREGVHGMAELPALLPGADVVIVVVPLTSETRGMIDARFLARMKDGALLVNVARGAVVVMDDLVAALQSERITAAVDVVEPEPLPAESPLFDVPGLLIAPHVGGISSAMWPRVYRLVREQLERIAAGDEPVNIVSGEY